jgi:hypothetical protein
LRSKKFLCNVCNAGYRDHTNPLFKQMGILPLNEMITFSNLKFMHQFWHKKLPLSFHETRNTNRARNPNIALRNAENLYSQAHDYATLKRMPLFSFPKVWNEDINPKLNPSPRLYLKSVKSALLNSIV